MEGRLLLKNCSVFRADGRVKDKMAVLIDGGTISAVDEDASVPARPGDWSVACDGRLLAPGLVDCHAHLVNAQLMPQSGELWLRSSRGRYELEQKLGSLLRAPEVEALSAFAMARALRSGATMVVEHLYCPNDTEAALVAQARAAIRLGIRLCNAHATHSLDGEQAANRQLEDNARYAEAHRSHALVRPALGFHASFNAEDSLLQGIGRAKEALGVGTVFHLAESEEDLAATFTRYSTRIVPRLDAFGLLGPGAVAAHARAVDRSESERLASTRTLIALGPRFNQVAEPGGGGVEAVFAHQNLLGLGTSGAGNVWEELFSAFAGIIQIARVRRLLDPDGFLSQLLIGGPAELCSMLYQRPCGTVEAGSLADLVLYDHVAAQPVGSSLPLLLQLGSTRPAWVIVNGRVVVREGQLVGYDYVELARNASRALESLWKRVGAAT